jgi:methylmalonyl-CoA mutase C-terminal domain/subunit
MSEAATSMTPIRVLMGKVGLDGHDRGAKVVMAALRDAGMEVIYSGLHQSPEALVRAAVEEDVHLIGISILSGAHKTLIPKLIAELKKNKLSHIPVFVGGIIPESDVKALKKAGVRRVFTPGTRLDDIVEGVRGDVVKSKKGAKKGGKKK